MTQIGDEIAKLFEPHQPLPIPTEYNSIQFRSRLEARWAVFMDAARIRWVYEFEGYQLPAGWYVPDFWLPDLEVWLEIKPASPKDRESEKCEQLAWATQKCVYLAIGQPDLPAYTGGGSGDSLLCFSQEGFVDACYAFCVCSVCGELGIAFEGRGDRVCKQRCSETDRGHTGDRPRFARAVEAARVMRFW